MSTVAFPVWLARAYAAALAVHFCAVAVLVLLTVPAGVGSGANAAPDTWLFMAAVALPVLLAALPSAMALLSWHLCRRQGAVPSPGHMGLSIAAALAVMSVAGWVLVA